VKANGEPCRGRRHDGSDKCFFHDNPAAVVAAGRKGGDVTRKRRAKAVLPKSCTVSLESADEVRHLLADTITRVRRGQLDTSVSNAIGYLCQTGMKVLELTELERRLAAIEEKLGGGS
jgi:hypothetical protein